MLSNLFLLDVSELARRFIDVNDDTFEDPFISMVYEKIFKPNILTILSLAVQDAVDNDLAWTSGSNKLDDALAPHIEHIIINGSNLPILSTPDDLRSTTHMKHKRDAFNALKKAIYIQIVDEVRVLANAASDVVYKRLWGGEDRNEYRWQIIRVDVTKQNRAIMFTIEGDYRIKTFYKLLSEGKIDLGRKQETEQEEIYKPIEQEPPVHYRHTPSEIRDIASLRRKIVNTYLNKQSENNRLFSYKNIPKIRDMEFDDSVKVANLLENIIDTTKL